MSVIGRQSGALTGLDHPSSAAGCGYTPAMSRDRARPPVLPGILLGLGFGGFVDGIVLHQVLQWHHMISDTAAHPPTTVSGLEANTLADGIFHAATWTVTALGVWLLWRAAKQGRRFVADRAFLGWVLAGWGAFNIADALLFHFVLGLHHIREGAANETAYDVAWLILGCVQLAAGWALSRRPADRAAPAG